MYSDGDRYGKVVDALLGRDCTAILATNSIKVAFGDGQKGCAYIWIDPPWRFEQDGQCVTSSSEYADEDFKTWVRLLDPLRPTTLLGLTDRDGAITFTFAGGHTLVVPCEGATPDNESWYSHWYATLGSA